MREFINIINEASHRESITMQNPVAESFEAAFYVRKKGSNKDFELKWLTVPTNDRAAAIQAYRDLGYDVKGGTIMTQAEATEQAKKF
jgi:hypothetical protein